jgi:molybdopterin molybdotransferase
MIEYQEALRLVLSAAKPRGQEFIPLAESLGRTLGRDVRAGEDIPPFAKSAMDGYAVRAVDTLAAAPSGPAGLDVILDLPAGRRTRKSIGPGQAARIMTGAPLPRGTDAVVMVEDTERTGDGKKVKVGREVRPGDNIGLAGEDVRKGELVLERGDVLGPAEVGMLAALGRRRVPAVRRPRLAVVSTGNEIVEPGQKAPSGKIRNSNGWALSALSLRAGAETFYLGIARDNPFSLRAALRRAAGADILVLSGGVSVGDYDLVKDELESAGVRTVFWRVRVKPGKPVFFGLRGRQLVFGLPGNPVSAMVTFHLFVQPAVEAMLGRKRVGPPAGRAILASDLILKPGRTQFLRGVLDPGGPVLRVSPFPDQRSGVLKSMVRSGVLVVVPSEAARLNKGTEVEILFIGGQNPWPS